MVDERERETERTTVVHTEGRRGGGGIALAVVLLLIAFMLYMFRDEIFGAAQDVDKVDVDIATTNGS